LEQQERIAHVINSSLSGEASIRSPKERDRSRHHLAHRGGLRLSTGTRPYGDCWSTLCCLAVWSIWVESSTALGGFRVLKKTSEAPYTTKVNYRVRTTRGTTLYTPSRVFVARPARSAARLVGHAAAAQTRRVQPASLLQAHLQVRRSTRFLGQLYKSGFTELCDVIMRTNETPLAAATHKLNQLKDKAGLSDAPADDSGRPRGRICG